MELVFQGYTNKDGVVIFSLSPGKYYYREFDPPEGYQIDDTPFPFEIRWDGDIVKAVMTNEKATGRLELTKTDVSTGKPIPDCGVEILTKPGKSCSRDGRIKTALLFSPTYLPANISTGNLTRRKDTFWTAPNSLLKSRKTGKL